MTSDAPGPQATLDASSIDRDPAARGVLYQTLSQAFEHPTEDLYRDLADGQIERGLRTTVDRTALDVSVPDLAPEGDYKRLSSRYNRLFALGSAVVTDRTDGSVDTEGPAVSLYEASHREATWNTINVDLARAYEFYDLSVDTAERDHHDNLRLQLEFAGYLARREAIGEGDAAAARRDLLDRHLTVFASSLRDDLDATPVAGLFADLAQFLDAVVEADHADLIDRLGPASDGEDREVTW